jgi:phage shock protein C
MAEVKRLSRSRDEKVIAGICGGLGKYFSVDPVIMRIIWLVLVFGGFGSGILIYIICWLVIPFEPELNEWSDSDE